MARKYQKEFVVTMTAKSEDGEMTVKQMMSNLKSKASGVSDIKLEINSVVQTYPEIPKVEESVNTGPGENAPSAVTPEPQSIPA